MRSYRLFVLTVLTGAVAPRFALADDVSVTKGPDTIEFRVGQELAGAYQFAGTVPREKGEGRKPLPKPVLWPLAAPGGITVTAFAPSDHIHHKSVWFCHGDVIPEGVELKVKSGDKRVKGVDFWSEAPNHGWIVCTQVGEPQAVGKGHSKVETRNEWKTPDGVKILDETRVIHFINQPEGRLFVFEISLRASISPVVFGDTKEGSFGIRVHPELRPTTKEGATITTADGKTIAPPVKDNLAIWGEPTAWVDYSGRVDGKAVGIAVFDHPDNPPASWHARAYGLNAANPFGRAASGFPSQKGKTDLLRLEKGGELKLKYGVYAHTGDAKTGKVAEAFAAFKK
jgi:hypothetical protein